MKLKFTVIFAFISVFSLSFLTIDILHEKVIKPFNEIVSTTHEEGEISTDSYRYRVSVFDGKLAVFSGDSKVPYKVYETYVDSLPENDVRLLYDGIFVNTSKDLIKIIEEYTS